MKYCKSCKIAIENNLTKCPLCGSYTKETDDKYNDDYPIVTTSYLNDIINRAMFFAAIAISVLSLFVNRYLAKSVPWSFIAIVGVFYLLLSSKFIIKKKWNSGFFILSQVFLVSVVVSVIDKLLGNLGWSVDYAIPFIIISGSLSMLIISIVKPYKYKEYIVYLLVIALMGLVPLIFILCDLTRVFWTSALCVIYSVLTVLAMLIFTHRRFNVELIKRLHF